ncbi:MAG: HAD hydrolase-like protein, partial [Oscillospiraceae bacterium]|nr:HAD hydrolase-like protein [Oscillospiraceae bacterium]
IRADTHELVKFIGPPLRRSFVEFYGFTAEQTEQAIGKYREYFAEHGIFENAVYPGIPALLKRLADDGRRLILATSKAEVYAQKILEHFGLAGYFSFVCGDTLDGSRGEKADIIRHILDSVHGIAPDNAVMVGDRRHDILGAKANNIRSIGVLYGYGDEAEMIEAGADWIARDVPELAALLGADK